MRLVFQVINHLDRKIFLDTKCLTHHQQQLRYRHRPAKLTTSVTTEKPKCLEGAPPPKKSFWRIFGRKEPKCAEVKIEKPDCLKTTRPVSEHQIEQDLDRISEMGGKAYRTCGPGAYVLQKDQLERPVVKIPSEEIILEEMMKDPSLKGQCDPMPAFESVEKRLIDMNERKLHPSYKILMSIAKKPPSPSFKLPSVKPTYSMRSGPIMPDEIPDHLKINKEMFEKKNIFHEFKKAMPPQQMLSRLAEMKKNEKPTMQKKIENKKKAKQ